MMGYYGEYANNNLSKGTPPTVPTQPTNAKMKQVVILLDILIFAMLCIISFGTGYLIAFSYDRYQVARGLPEPDIVLEAQPAPFYPNPKFYQPKTTGLFEAIGDADDITYSIKSGQRVAFSFSDTSLLRITSCTITVISEEAALTSGHCAKQASYIWVEEEYGEPVMIGKVVANYQRNIPGEKDQNGVDLAVIEFNDNVVGVPEALAETIPAPGREVSLHGAISKGSQGRVLRQQCDSDNDCVIVTDALVRPGDSGGPAYNNKGEIIGIIEWAVLETGVSGITSVDSIRSLLYPVV